MSRSWIKRVVSDNTDWAQGQGHGDELTEDSLRKVPESWVSAQKDSIEHSLEMAAEIPEINLGRHLESGMT